MGQRADRQLRWPGIRGPRGIESLLHAAGLPELVTTTLVDYERLALKLARDPVARGALLEKLSSCRARVPYFDSRRHARMMEAAYRQMWRTAQTGGPPKGFALTLEAVL